MAEITRRVFLGGAGATVAVGAMAQGRRRASGTGFVEVVRQPDEVTAFAGLERPIRLNREEETWRSGKVAVGAKVNDRTRTVRVTVGSPEEELTHVRLRWSGALTGELKVLGDAWERSYGDLGWKAPDAERVLPWYCAVHAADGTHGYGVKTGAGAFASWRVDTEGVTLWLDVRNGGRGVVLGRRELEAATVVGRKGGWDEDPLDAVKAFCGRMTLAANAKELPALFGTNDWYYAYGKNSADGIERDADLMASLAPAGGVRPFTIIDDGWRVPEKFPDMRGLAKRIAGKGVRPGIWVRPLQAPADAKETWLLPGARFGQKTERAKELAYDPTIPEARSLVLNKIAEVVEWGYELVKHDFSTYELFGQWGFEMGASPTLPGWGFHDRNKTNAEIVNELYSDIRRTCGTSTVIGCNTIGHLSAGLFEASRTGDDVSGKDWDRTRRMGVNTLAFRLAQNRTFFVGDPDCVPLTKAVAWDKTKQWLDVVARSGTALIVSPEPGAVGAEQRDALREAFAIAARPVRDARPLDWMETMTPQTWRFNNKKPLTYAWSGGAKVEG